MRRALSGLDGRVEVCLGRQVHLAQEVGEADDEGDRAAARGRAGRLISSSQSEISFWGGDISLPQA